MKAITANRLSDGVVVYVGAGEALVDRFDDAQLFNPDEAESVLARLFNRKDAIASAYLIDAEAAGPSGRSALREKIRRNGPTVRPDLGKQAELIDERL